MLIMQFGCNRYKLSAVMFEELSKARKHRRRFYPAERLVYMWRGGSAFLTYDLRLGPDYPGQGRSLDVSLPD
jgi:hypothetical protein